MTLQAKTTHVLLASGVDRASVPHRLLPPPPPPPSSSVNLTQDDDGGGPSVSAHALVVDENWLFKVLRRAAAVSPAVAVQQPSSSAAASRHTAAVRPPMKVTSEPAKGKQAVARKRPETTSADGDRGEDPPVAAPATTGGKRRKLIKATPARMTRVARFLSADPSRGLALTGLSACSEVHHRFHVAEGPRLEPETAGGGGASGLHASSSSATAARYTCDVRETPGCDCAEFLEKDADYPCRHLAFVFVKA